MHRTRVGHEIKVVGNNRLLAKYSGIKDKRVILTSMLLSGGIAGSIGATEVLGPLHRMPQDFNPGIGFDGVVVSLLAKNNPVGVIFAGFFFGALRNGALNMERFSEVPAAVSDVVQAIIILIVSAQVTIPFAKIIIIRFRNNITGDEESVL
jgi:simple sugar transport system permease protein